MRLSLTVLVVGLLTLASRACLQSYKEEHTLDHRTALIQDWASATEYVDWLRTRHRNRDYWEGERTSKAKKLAENPSDLEVANDYAVILVHLGQLQEGLERLRSLEQDHPGLYVTAANLGTALELAGQDAQALEWIQEGIRRNPDSHYGTEWVHVKILEAKLALARDPRWLVGHTVLGYNFGNQPPPRVPEQLPTPADQQKVIFALEYQLMERLEFVKPPDPVVADLLFDLGNLQALKTSVERGAALLQVSQSFGPAQADLVQARLAYLRMQSPPPQ